MKKHEFYYRNNKNKTRSRYCDMCNAKPGAKCKTGCVAAKASK